MQGKIYIPCRFLHVLHTHIKEQLPTLTKLGKWVNKDWDVLI